jgi:hypothetical protein
MQRKVRKRALASHLKRDKKLHTGEGRSQLPQLPIIGRKSVRS